MYVFPPLESMDPCASYDKGEYSVTKSDKTHLPTKQNFLGNVIGSRTNNVNFKELKFSMTGLII
jgi:hypothetical protein